MKTDDKIFILCIGAQKAGTTWLYHQLRKTHSVDLGMRKEYKAFKETSSRFSRVTASLKNTIHEALDQLSKKTNAHNQIIKAQTSSWTPNAYSQYFQNLHASKPKTRAVGDISPHYFSLRSHDHKYVRNLLEKAGFSVKIIILLRDPVERIWSQLRMLRSQNRFPELCGFKSEETALAMVYKHPRFSAKTRYDLAINAVSKAYNKNQVHIEFYERLFNQTAYEKLKYFLGLELAEPDFEQRLNASPKTKSICPLLQKKIANEYKQVYLEMMNMHGKLILDLWPSARLVK